MLSKTVRRTAARCAVMSIVFSAVLWGQTSESTQELKKRAFELSNQQKFTEALPLLEKVVVSDPADPDVHFFLAFALLGQAQITNDSAERAALRVRARNAFVKAKELGTKYPVVDALIQSLPVDGSDSGSKAFSSNPAANDLMNQGEAFFAQGKLESALNNYKAALQLDPKIYEAALYSGDVYNQKNDYDQAEISYQKAIAIDPSRETAYRYSATPWMKQKRYDVARERYIAAYLAEPYSKFSAAGLKQWAAITNTRLGNPNIDIPTSVTFDEKGGSTINLDSSALLGGKNDGSFAWIIYGGTRSLWKKEKFAKTFPKETNYRHSLPEEADALRGVVHMAATDKKVTALSPSLAALKKLDDAGLLEAYILLVRADQGIAVDYPGYLKQNRDKLYRYVVEYLLTGGGSSH